VCGGGRSKIGCLMRDWLRFWCLKRKMMNNDWERENEFFFLYFCLFEYMCVSCWVRECGDFFCFNDFFKSVWWSQTKCVRLFLRGILFFGGGGLAWVRGHNHLFLLTEKITFTPNFYTHLLFSRFLENFHHLLQASNHFSKNSFFFINNTVFLFLLFSKKIQEIFY
jgi:hypothetical protein